MKYKVLKEARAKDC